MTTKRLLFTFILTASTLFCHAQSIVNISVQVSNSRTIIRSIELATSQLIFCVDERGHISFNPNTLIVPDSLTVNDRAITTNISVKYYDQFDGFDNVGKLKMVNDVKITYYDTFDGDDKNGRLKSIGDFTFNYYDRFDGFYNIGKLKAIGNNKIDYYTAFDGFDNIGKLKQIGNTHFTYFDRFDGGQNAGKIKSINGQTPYLTIYNQ